MICLNGRLLAQLHDAWRDFSKPLSLVTFLRNVGNGAIPFPVMRLGKSEKGTWRRPHHRLG